MKISFLIWVILGSTVVGRAEFYEELDLQGFLEQVAEEQDEHKSKLTNLN